MSDNSLGSSITIPGILISKQDGQKLKDFILENKGYPLILDQISLIIDFEIKKKREARVDIFFSADTYEVYKLLKDFLPYEKEFDNKERIVPHSVYNAHPDFKENENKDYPHCVSAGRYCYFPINHTIEEKYPLNITDGRLVINETLVQKCIWLNNRHLFLPYMTEFYHCVYNNDFTRECSERVFTRVNLTSKNVYECLNKSFTDEKDYRLTSNFFLEKDAITRKYYELAFLPDIFVNDKVFMSSWTKENLVEALCSGISNKPEICYKMGFFNKPKVENQRKTLIIVILIIIIIALPLNILVIVVCRRYIQKKVSERVDSSDFDGRVNNVLSSYLQMKDSNNN